MRPRIATRLFARQIFPLLLQARPALQNAYCDGNGRPGLEPAVMAGVTVLQFLQGVPDRETLRLALEELDCKHCPLRAQCVGPGQAHRTLVVGQYHSLLKTPGFSAESNV